MPAGACWGSNIVANTKEDIVYDSFIRGKHHYNENAQYACKNIVAQYCNDVYIFPYWFIWVHMHELSDLIENWTIPICSQNIFI